VWNPVAGERDVLVIEVKLAHYKRAKRRLKLLVNEPILYHMCSKSKLINYDSMIFFFTEVDDPIFCLITHLVSLAIVDRAFEALSLTMVERVFEYKV
jgi:hypothetical protein